MASLAPQDISGSGSQEHKREDDGIREALEKVTATMYSISSKGGSELGPVLTAEVLLEGEAVEALLDTGSPVTIVSLEFLVQV